MVNEMLHIGKNTQTTCQHKSIKITNIIMNTFQLQQFKKSFFMKEMFIIHIIKLKDFADQPNSAEVTKSIYRI